MALSNTRSRCALPPLPIVTYSFPDGTNHTPIAAPPSSLPSTSCSLIYRIYPARTALSPQHDDPSILKPVGYSCYSQNVFHNGPSHPIVLLTLSPRIHRGHLINGSPSPKSRTSRHPINYQRQSYTGINVQFHSIRTVPDTPILSPCHRLTGFPLSHPDLDFMISTAYPYPVNNDKSTARRRAALQPHIYSPSESHTSPRNTMYPHLHTSGSPTPNYIYSGYEQYYSKDSWVTVAPSSWPTFYHLPRSSALPETAFNPKVSIHPPQPILVSDIDTPSSISSHSILTPSSPMDVEFQAMEFDEFDYDDEDDFVDSDFADEMEGIDEADQGPSPLYGASAPQVIKSTSALEGALGDAPSSSYYGTHLGVFTPADRRLSASVPGYPSNSSHRTTASNHQRWTDKAYSPALAASSPSPTAPYPSQHTYTQRNYSSPASLFTPPSLYNPSSSSSLAGAFAPSVPSPHASRPTSNPLPILQPQPIRPIPPIPLADLTSDANERCSAASPRTHASRTLSPLPLLCQPVSDVVRYQLKELPASGALEEDVSCCDDSNAHASESMCDDLITTPEDDRFAQPGLTFCPEHASSTDGTCEKLYSCGCIHLPVRWQ